MDNVIEIQSRMASAIGGTDAEAQATPANPTEADLIAAAAKAVVPPRVIPPKVTKKKLDDAADRAAKREAEALPPAAPAEATVDKAPKAAPAKKKPRAKAPKADTKPLAKIVENNADPIERLRTALGLTSNSLRSQFFNELITSSEMAQAALAKKLGVEPRALLAIARYLTPRLDRSGYELSRSEREGVWTFALTRSKAEKVKA